VDVFASDLVRDEWERTPREIAPASRAADNDIRVVSYDVELLLGLLSDDGLVEEHMVQNASK